MSKAYPFDIGDISDIVMVGPLDELSRRSRIVRSDGRNYGLGSIISQFTGALDLF